MLSLRLLALTTTVLALGCGGGKDALNDDGLDTGSGPDDTGDTTPKYEEGCILVDGAGGYKWLEDALEVAGEGSTVSLCEGEMDMSIEISGSVNLIGPGADLLHWTAETNKPAIKVTGGAEVTLAGFTVSSTRNGIEIANSSDVTVSEVTFVDVLGTGVRSIDSTGTVVDTCTFQQPPSEGGGDTGSPVDTGSSDDTAAPVDSGADTGGAVAELWDTGAPADPIPYTDNPIGYGGVEVSGGDASVNNSTFIQMVGFAVNAINSGSVSVSDSAIYYTVYGEPDADGNVADGFSLWVQDGSILTTSNNLLANNFVGVFADEGDLNLSGDFIAGGAYGVFAVNGAFSIDGVRVENPFQTGMRLVSATEPVSVSNTTVWGDPDVVAPGDSMDGMSTGVLIAAAEIDVSDSTIHGWNYMGLQLIPYDNDVSASLNNVTIENAATNGLYGGEGDFDLVDVEVIDFRTPYDPYTDDGASINSGFASSFWYSDVTWSGGGVKNSEFIGTLAAFSSLAIDGIEVDGNAHNGLWIYDSTAAISGSTFTNSSAYGGVVSSSGDVTLSGNTFADNLEDSYSEYDSGTVVYGYLYSYQSQDITSYSGSRLDVLNNTFTNGSEGIRVVGGTNTSIEDNVWTDYNRNAIYVYATDDTVKVKNNTVNNIGSYFIYCSSNDIEISETTIDGVVGYNYKTTYFQDGVQTSTYEATWYDPAIYASSCGFYGESLDIRNSKDQSVSFYDSAVELYDSVFENSASEGYSEYGTIDFRWSSTSPSLIANNLDIRNVDAGHGIRLQNTSGLTGSVSMSNIGIDNAYKSGIRLDGLTSDTVSLTGITATNNGYAGIESTNVSGSLSQLTATGNSLGMTCDSLTSFDPCELLTLTSNSAGEHEGCASACLALAGSGGDTGDTGSSTDTASPSDTGDTGN
ncbi:MAG: right-handed parallel beta-helix repeat-containing protein [Myxococcota bacterium]|nr:right-handed parallel beta-helix repeat-containing protein [Myxococcota bacterium]